METQMSINDWARSVGINANPRRSVERASEELAEALVEIDAGQHLAAGIELADVVVCLYVAASRIGVNLQNLIDAKMEVNRKREWRLDESGCAYHI